MDDPVPARMPAPHNWRALYRLALNPECFLESDYLDNILSGCELTPLYQLSQQIDAWKQAQTKAYARAAATAVETNSACAFAQALAVYSAPMASILGCWLQGMSAPGVFEDPAQLRLMQLLAHDVGVGYPNASRAHHFNTLLSQLQLNAYALAPAQLATLPDLLDDAFELPALLLALSRRSETFGDELCGVDWALRTVGLFPGWAVMGQLEGIALDVQRLDLSEAFKGLASASLCHISQWITQQVAEQGEERLVRLLRGANWLLGALQRWNARLYNASLTTTSPQKAIAHLIQRMARVGAVYHRHYLMEGRSLALWFEEAQHDPLPFLDALSRSPLIVPGNSKQSPLVNSLVAPTGRMFRIFSEMDLSVIRQWIDWLPRACDDQLMKRRVDGPPNTSPQDIGTDADMGHWPHNLREAYFVLQGRALQPVTLKFARRYVYRWLARSRQSLKTSERQLPERWGTSVLRAWLLDKHDQNGRQFDSRDPAQMPNREEIINSTLQLAPLTLIDGAWLQGFTDIGLASSHVGYTLFQTYWDELGNGDAALNHPKIYRDGLREMGFELAPTGSREFAQDVRLDEDSFRLPVYWLCLGKLPVTFMPEILGMNLAMELSGVGGAYRSARHFLQHYGFSTAFVDLHNTIDNVSTGHSAWAADAIDAYMRSFTTFEDAAAQWQRVRVGYESLAPRPSEWESLLRWVGLSTAGCVLPRIERAKASKEYLHHLPITAKV
ncbi:iron-containing redox enzyme family protein [Pseudomonas syringae pv. syringae]|uniref:iron-containing redox enzyme family protein n=1 Tax=Pseudomonas TaxID=286 RepID=UPI001CE39AF4|nr:MULTISPECIES: iron-containing redox enzyme family protein [Pseudomonas]MCA5967994.1 iron-containing redox enzyme family protein [Pseudomonas sp. P129]MEE1991748.1 iron-containing redox enzyme family protein [Pseudomonas syringae pv. syringae]MEE1996803.1 iron-containing redox enzyme family protein [Pseudomonas syringae pv. syringae]